MGSSSYSATKGAEIGCMGAKSRIPKSLGRIIAAVSRGSGCLAGGTGCRLRKAKAPISEFMGGAG